MYEELFTPATTDAEAVERLRKIIEVLRSPEGCPWDKVQTHDSLRRGMIEEAYEVVDAIEKGDDANLREELGDVLLQVLFHADLADDEGKFSLADVANEECEKMIRRHPHVFAVKEEGLSPADVLVKWDEIKKTEKSESQTASMEKIPRELPALLRAEKIQAKAAKVGFDWSDVSGAFDKVAEESGELMEAYHEMRMMGVKTPHVSDELGDLLFAVVNVARFLEIDPEDALNGCSAKFMRRFAYIEERVTGLGKKMTDMTLPQMDLLWEEAKEKGL